MIRKMSIKVLVFILIICFVFINGCKQKPITDTSKDDEKPDIRSEDGNNEKTTQQGEDEKKIVDENGDGSAVETDYNLPIVDEPITLTFMCRENQMATAPTYDSGELPVWNEVEKLTNVKIKWETVIAQDYDVAVQTKLAAASDLPDMICVPDPTPYLRQQIFIPMDDLIEKYAPDIKSMLEEHPDVKGSITAFDGKIYCITQIPKAINEIHTRMLFIREDWLDRLELSMPETIDDWYGVLKAFKEEDANGNGDQNDEFPMLSPGASEVGNRAFASAFDIEYAYADGYSVDADGNVRLDWIRPEAKEYMEFIKKLIDEKLFVRVDDNERDMRLSDDTAGSIDRWPDAIAGRNLLLKEIVPNGKYVGAPAPSSSHNPGYYITPNPSYGYETGIFITKECQQPEIAMQWINFLFSKEGYLLTNFGIEGEHYNIVDGKPVITEYYTKNPDGLDPGEAQRMLGARPSFANFMSREFEEQCKRADPNIGPTVDILLEYSKSPSFPKCMADKDEVEVLKTVGLDLATYIEENTNKFMLGERDLAEFDKFVDEVKSMGLDEVLDVKQKQYNRYVDNMK